MGDNCKTIEIGYDKEVQRISQGSSSLLNRQAKAIRQYVNVSMCVRFDHMET